MTFYVTDFKYPYDSIATLPGFSVEEAVNVIQNDSYYNEHCVPLTAEERKRFINKCKDFDGKDGITEADCRRVYESMKESFMYEKFLNGDIDSNISYSFWITSAYDTYTTVFAVGADTVGSYDFNLTRIAKKLGEKNFYNYTTGKGKRVKNFSTLVKILNENGINDFNYTKEDLIQACNEDRYFILRK